ncbi:GMC family oxidoreductase N-terminal domain-containing protein [Pseudomonas gingeri]|uniref:GMC family oxidoreductase n=1 Tax=Pseudomonas gingeri TaxID=117681 RepID=UPI0015A0FE04|nr:GMC oxidoreductase [Pseudomonas gingeri]NVZ24689.1 GMC family oxidoreductase N-terminal domain-containing protein [Pseudomonas gingeri]
MSDSSDLINPGRRKVLGQTLALSAATLVGAGLGIGCDAYADNKPAGKGQGEAPFDVIIVGAGSAGAVLAARLSENPRRRVLLLEAGNNYAPDRYPKELVKSDTVGANLDPRFEWGYKTEPGYVGHPILAIRGKVVGGSSAINGAVAVRSRPEDFARWNLPGWSYEDMLPAFIKLEAHSGGATGRHGAKGPLPVHQLARADVTPMQRAFIDSTVASGFKAIADFDGEEANGVGPYAMNVVNGERINTGMAYLTSAVRTRPNLTIISDGLVDKVLFDNKRANGIKLANGASYRGHEVVLSAGVYGSAAVLMRSGIAPADHSRRLGLPVLVDLPVGQNLVDHPFYYNAYAARPEKLGAQSPAIGAFLWTHSSTAARGELDLHITATHLFPQDKSPTGAGFVLAVALTRPLSRGKFWLDSLDPSAAPRIDLNFLAQEHDRQRLLEGVKLSRRIAQRPPLSEMIASELMPGEDARSDEEILAAIKATLDSYEHPAGTAPMGLASDPAAVVDLQGRVHGITGLRVVDASIFPDAMSAATNVTTIAAAEHIASMMG